MPKYTDPTTGKSFSSKEPLNEYELEEAFGVSRRKDRTTTNTGLKVFYPVLAKI